MAGNAPPILGQELVNSIYELAQSNVILAQQLSDFNALVKYIITSAPGKKGGAQTVNDILNFFKDMTK